MSELASRIRQHQDRRAPGTSLRIQPAAWQKSSWWMRWTVSVPSTRYGHNDRTSKPSDSPAAIGIASAADSPAAEARAMQYASLATMPSIGGQGNLDDVRAGRPPAGDPNSVPLPENGQLVLRAGQREPNAFVVLARVLPEGGVRVVRPAVFPSWRSSSHSGGGASRNGGDSPSAASEIAPAHSPPISASTENTFPAETWKRRAIDLRNSPSGSRPEKNGRHSSSSYGSLRTGRATERRAGRPCSEPLQPR